MGGLNTSNNLNANSKGAKEVLEHIPIDADGQHRQFTYIDSCFDAIVGITTDGYVVVWGERTKSAYIVSETGEKINVYVNNTVKSARKI